MAIEFALFYEERSIYLFAYSKFVIFVFHVIYEDCVNLNRVL